jgi:hypothetical protein
MESRLENFTSACNEAKSACHGRNRIRDHEFYAHWPTATSALRWGNVLTTSRRTVSWSAWSGMFIHFKTSDLASLICQDIPARVESESYVGKICRY